MSKKRPDIVLYINGIWTPSLIGIALMFGIGNVFDSVVSLAAYVFLLKKKRINIMDVDKALVNNR